MRIFVGASSSNDINEKYLIDCKKYINALFNDDNDLVFGAYNQGIMGISYETALFYNKSITGICPDVYKSGFNYINCTKEVVTRTIGERTNAIIEESDAFVLLPGGIGTIYEFFHLLESKRSGEYSKPIIVYNSQKYFDKLLIFLDQMYKEQFTSISVADCYHISTTIEDTLEYLNNYKVNKK